MKGRHKSARTQELLGCSIEFLRGYLEARFKKGMTWDNYGMWHIDHIFPCAIFNMADPVEQKQCFHYSNLQPLWAKDNWKKSDNIIFVEAQNGGK